MPPDDELDLITDVFAHELAGNPDAAIPLVDRLAASRLEAITNSS